MDRDRLRAIVTGLLDETSSADLSALAKQVGVVDTLVYHWKSGRRIPPPDKLSALLRHLNAPKDMCNAAFRAAGVDLSLVEDHTDAPAGCA